MVSKINFELVQYISISLLVFSTVAPHGVRKSKGKRGFEESEGAAAPITAGLQNDNITEKTPLTFL